VTGIDDHKNSTGSCRGTGATSGATGDSTRTATANGTSR